MEVIITKTIDIQSLTLDDIKSLSRETLIDIVSDLLHQPEKHNPKGGLPYGYKRKNATSQFHYVSWSNYDKLWIAQPMGHIVGKYDDEIVAALAADKYLDDIGDVDRPRNRAILAKVV